MPTSFAWLFSKLPLTIHRIEVLLTLVEQLVLPFAMLSPIRFFRLNACKLELFFQSALILTGNYAWVNYISILVCLSLLDDVFLKKLFGIKELPAKLEVRKNSKVLKYANISLQTIYNLICLLLFLFISVKSVNPVQEFFAESPWLHFYDDYFLVNAQGLFGFINENRLVVSVNVSTTPQQEWQEIASELSDNKYLIDDIVGSYFKKSIYCEDSDAPVTTTAEGVHIYCSSMLQYCYNNDFIRGLCPVTCDSCDSFPLERLMPQAVREELFQDFKFFNLPDKEVTRHGFTSPYHNRLSWETWIKTTASLEEVAQKHVTVKKLFQEHKKTLLYKYLPPMTAIDAHLKLFRRIFEGCTDPLLLISSRFEDLFQLAPTVNGTRFVPPSAFMMSYYVYNFSDTLNVFDVVFADGARIWRSSRASKDILVMNPYDWNVTGGYCPYSSPQPWTRIYKLLVLALLFACQSTKLLNYPEKPTYKLLTFVSTASILTSFLVLLSMDYSFLPFCFLLKMICYPLYFAVALIQLGYSAFKTPKFHFFVEVSLVIFTCFI